MTVLQASFVDKWTGGMITGLDNASKMISECPKPVVAYIAGACASAHFWLASAADKRFLGSLMCEVGSIGVVGTYYNAKEALKKKESIIGRFTRIRPT